MYSSLADVVYFYILLFKNLFNEISSTPKILYQQTVNERQIKQCIHNSNK